MNGFPKIYLILFAFFALFSASKSAMATGSTLTSKPAKCVSLKQGNICYQDVRIRWKTGQAANYCLYNKAQTEALKCWQQLDHGEHHFEFAFPQTQHFVLRQIGDKNNLASTVIEVKWVYKARRHNRFSWRVF